MNSSRVFLLNRVLSGLRRGIYYVEDGWGKRGNKKWRFGYMIGG